MARRPHPRSPPRQQGWGLVVVLVALAIAAFLARDALLQHFGGPTSSAAWRETRLPADARMPTDSTQATPVVATPVERARAVEDVVQRQAEELGRRIDREAR